MYVWAGVVSQYLKLPLAMLVSNTGADLSLSCFTSNAAF